MRRLLPRRFSSVLDECLAALSRGDSVDACLDRYPRHAERLRTHLLLAHRLSLTPRREPRPIAQSAAWRQFSARAEDMRLGRGPRFSLNLRFGWMKPLAVAAVLVLAVVAAGGGTVYAAQDASPNSPLYTVKLWGEDARLWFVFDDVREAEILLDQSNQRTEEVMELVVNGDDIPGNVLDAMRDRNASAVRILEDEPEELALLARAREQAAEQEELLLALSGDIADSAQDDYAETVATLHNARLRTTGVPGSVRPDDLGAGVINITGTAELTDEDLWSVGGVELTFDARALGDDLESGQEAQIIAARGVDGSLLALKVTITDRGRPDQKFLVSGAIEDFGEDEVVIAGQRIAVTERTLLKLRLLRGQQVEVSVEDVDGQAVASIIQGSSGGAQQSEPPLLAYEGMIEEEISVQGATSRWLVGGQRFLVTPETELDARSGILARGARARVEAVTRDGDTVAKRIIVLAAAVDEPEEDAPVRVEGVLETGDADTWVVSGLEVTAPSDAETPAIGSLVTMEARRVGRALVVETLTTSFSPGVDGFVLLRGQIGDVEDGGTWRVGLAKTRVDERTVVVGSPQAGTRVFIWASRDDEGSLRAVYANVLDTRPLLKPEAGGEAEGEEEGDAAD